MSVGAPASTGDLNQQQVARAQGQGQASHVAPFDWKSNWYAVASAQDLDPSRPHPLMVLGRRIVLWFDQRLQKEIQGGLDGGTHSTAWRCFLDQCPHRLVPLSEGRIDEQGLLQCSYHGWTFSGDGSCQGIPQAAATGPEQNAIKSPRACAKAFPVAERRGIIFVWPEESPEGAVRAALTSPPTPAGIDDSFALSVFSREVLYGYDMLAENVMDPSHLPFAHHGVGPLDREKATPYPHASVISEREGAHGFVGRLHEPMMPTFSPVQFQAPGLFCYYRSLANLKGSAAENGDPKGPGETTKELTFDEVEAGRGGKVLLTALFITPVAPGRSRLTTLEGTNRPLKGLMGMIRGARWISHLFLQQVLDGDAYFLHAQEKAVDAIQVHQQQEEQQQQQASLSPNRSSEHASQQHPADSSVLTQDASAGEEMRPSANGSAKGAPPSLVSSAYFLPTSADRFVIGFRRWLDRHGGGGVEWPVEFTGSVLEPDWTPKEKVLDRYQGHTASCTACQSALAGFRLAQKVLLALAVALLLLALNLRSGVLAKSVAAIAGAACGVVVFKLPSIIRLFVYTGYDHALK